MNGHVLVRYVKIPEGSNYLVVNGGSDERSVWVWGIHFPHSYWQPGNLTRSLGKS